MLGLQLVELTETEARALLLRAVHEAGSQKVIAYKIHSTESYLSEVIDKRRPLGPKILSFLNLEAVTTTVYRVRSE